MAGNEEVKGGEGAGDGWFRRKSGFRPPVAETVHAPPGASPHILCRSHEPLSRDYRQDQNWPRAHLMFKMTGRGPPVRDHSGRQCCPLCIRALTLGPAHAVVVLAKGMSILLNVVRTHEGGTNEVRHSKAAQEFHLLRHELLLGENIFLAQFREAFDCLHNVFHCERSRRSRSGCWRGGRGERS